MKRITFSLIIAIAIFGKNVSGQTIYLDVNTVPSMIIFNNSLKSGQNDTKNQLTGIRNAQAVVALQLHKAHELQEKIRKGLTEVSGVITDGLILKNILLMINEIGKAATETATIVSDDPQNAVFALPAASQVRSECLKLYRDVSAAITGGEINMLSSMERRQLLTGIRSKVEILYGSIRILNMTLLNAKQRSFFGNVKHFATWVNRDRTLINKIMNDAQFL